MVNGLYIEYLLRCSMILEKNEWWTVQTACEHEMQTKQEKKKENVSFKLKPHSYLCRVWAPKKEAHSGLLGTNNKK